MSFQIFWKCTDEVFGDWWLQCYSSWCVDAPGITDETGHRSIHSYVSAHLDVHTSNICLYIFQQPVWRWHARLGEVVPPPRLLLPLYSFLGDNWLAMALELVIGVKSIPAVCHGEEVVIYVWLHGKLFVWKMERSSDQIGIKQLHSANDMHRRWKCPLCIE